MGTVSPASLRQYLPYVFIVTVVITLTPAVLVWALASEGLVDGFVPLVLIGLTASLVLGYVGRTAWQRRPESRDFIFADLLLWGWIRRYRIERRLGSATALLGISNREARNDLHPAKQIEVLKDLATALESRDPYTHGHSRRVARYSAMIAEKLGLSDTEVSKVRTAAAVHDVGKLELPLDVLNKPGKLSDEEFTLIKSHAPLGAEMVKQLGDRELTEMVAHHHERLDGTGYPSRLSGNQIPLGARIIAVADTFDALTSTRAYRGAKRHNEALAILHAEAGTQLDPLAVQAFDRCYAGSLGGLTVWALLAALPHRLWAPLESQVNIAQAASGTFATKAIAVAVATAATGTIALSPLADPRDTSTDEGRASLAANSGLAGGGPAITRIVEDVEDPARPGPVFAGDRDRRGLEGDNAADARDAREPKSPRIGGVGAPSEPATSPAVAAPAPPAPVLVDNDTSAGEPSGAGMPQPEDGFPAMGGAETPAEPDKADPDTQGGNKPAKEDKANHGKGDGGKPEKPDKDPKTDKPGKPDKEPKPDKPGKPDKEPKPEMPGKPSEPGVGSGDPAEPGKPGKPGKPEKPGKDDEGADKPGKGTGNGLGVGTGGTGGQPDEEFGKPDKPGKGKGNAPAPPVEPAPITTATAQPAPAPVVPSQPAPAAPAGLPAGSDSSQPAPTPAPTPAPAPGPPSAPNVPDKLADLPSPGQP